MRLFNTKFIFFCFLLLAANITLGQKISPELYKSSTIPDSLKENANSVVRFSETVMEIKGPGKKTVKQHTIITLLNDKAEKEATIVLGYNRKYDTYSNIEIKVYNAEGKSIKKYYKGDMYDGAAISNSDLVTDERLLGVKHNIAAYPITLEISYEENVTSLVSLGSWQIQDNEQAIQYSSYKVLVDDAANFRYLNKNTTLQPQKTTGNNNNIYVWNVANLKAIKLEDGALAWRVLPQIYFGKKNFEFYGTQGNINSWESFGKWFLDLSSDVSSLTPKREAEIRKMTDTIKSDKEKARFLYQYMQKNMRYVSVQLGIGGFKPFPATFVDEKKYGDCKALSNYMHALLKAVNIPSYHAIINAGANAEPADPLFPNNRFNHMILCIPFKNDTTWLECTSTTQPFGILGSFTENRNALLVTPSGGVLMHTPKNSDTENQFNSRVNIKLDANGGAKATIKILSTGEYRSDYVQIATYKTEEQKEYIMRSLHLKQPGKFDINPSTDNGGVKEINLDLEYGELYDMKAGNKQFYKPILFDLWGVTVPVEEKRKSDFYFPQPIYKTCITAIKLPDGFEVETLPNDQKLSFTYGSYEVKYSYDTANNTVTSSISFKLSNNVIPAAKYNEMQQYMDAIIKAQNKKLVIHTKA